MLATADRATLVPASRVAPGARDGEHDLLVVRAWARSVGYPIDESSGVPLPVLRTYRRVHDC